MISHAMEDYLRTIYELGEIGETATTTAIAQWLKIAPASVTNMIKRLARLELVDHEPYYGVTLTAHGEKLALEVVRHHRLVELFLAEILAVPWDRVHREAHRLEHAVSAYLAERIANVLGNPVMDPHGQRIPDTEGHIADLDARKLSSVLPGESVIIVAVDDEDSELLRHLGKLRLYPNVQVHVVAHEPFGGPIRLTVDGVEQTIGIGAAEHIWVQTNGSEQ